RSTPRIICTAASRCSAAWRRRPTLPRQRERREPAKSRRRRNAGSVRVLVDTSALLALANGRDQWHTRAVRIARANAASGIRYVSTTLVLAEFHARVLYVRGPD